MTLSKNPQPQQTTTESDEQNRAGRGQKVEGFFQGSAEQQGISLQVKIVTEVEKNLAKGVSESGAGEYNVC